MINEPGGDVALEWIELFNTAVSTAHLVNFRFEEGGQQTGFADTDTIPAAGFAILSRQPIGETSFESRWGNGSGVWGDHSSESYPLIEISFSLRNSGDSVSLHELSTGSTEVVSWSSAGSDGVSLERTTPYQPATSEIFQECQASAGSTPGAVNSVILPDHDLEIVENSVIVDLANEGQPLTITGQIRNIGLLATDSTNLAHYFDRDFNGELDESDDLDSTMLPPLEPDSTNDFAIDLFEDFGRKSLYLSLPIDGDTTNNQSWLYFGLGEIFTELRLNEFVVNPTDDLDCEWIELQSVVTYDLNLRGFAVGNQQRTYEITTSMMVEPEQRLLLCEDSLNFVRYYGDPGCAIVEPDGWGNFHNDGDQMLLINDLGKISDSLHYSGSWADNVSWERDQDSLSGSFSHLYYRCSDFAGSTPCAANSVRPLPPERDLELIADSVTARWLIASDSIEVRALVVNRGLLPSEAIDLSIVIDRNFSHTIEPGDGLLIAELPALAAGDTGVAVASQYEPPGRVLLLLQLPRDDDNSNNEAEVELLVGEKLNELRITEFLVNPISELDCEWVELLNVAEYPLAGYDFRIGDQELRYRFGDCYPIESGERVILCESVDNFRLYYGDPNCQLIQPEGWNSFSDAGDLIVIEDDYGRFSDSVRFDGSWPENQTWERWENSDATTFDSLFHPAVDSVRSTPCAPNSIPADPLESDLGWLDDCLELTLPETAAEALTMKACVVNLGSMEAASASVFLYDDRNNDLVAQPEELVADFSIAGSLAPGDTTELILRQNLAPGYYQLLLLLSEDESPDNNQLDFEVSVGPVTGEIIVTEFLAATESPLECEWIECRNYSDRPIDLYGWAIGDSLRQSEFEQSVVVEPDSYFVATQDSLCFREFYEVDCLVLQPSSWSNLNNSGDRLLLFDDFGVLSDSVSYTESPSENHSLEQNEELYQSNGARTWYQSTATNGATPGAPNSVSGPEFSEIQVELLNQVFSPFLGESLRYKISVPPATLLTLEVFDLAGRRQFTIAEKRAYSSGEFDYAGNSDYYDRLPVGAYILQVSSDSYSERLSFAVAGPR